MDDIDLLAPNVTLPEGYQQSSVGISLTLLRPSCAAEAYAEGIPVEDAKYNTLLFNEADTVVTPGGGLAKFTAHVLAPPFCDDRSAVFMLNVMPIALVDTVYNMCPKHAIPDIKNGNADCPAGKVMVFLDITDGNWKKDPQYATVKQCVDPANFDQFSGEFAISYCWAFGQLPDPFSYKPFRIRMPNVTEYNVRRIPGGAFKTLVNMPIDRGVNVTLTLHPALKSLKDIVITESGTYTLPGSATYTGADGGIDSVDLEILVPHGLDDQSVSVQMFGNPNPPPPTEICPCPTPVPEDGVCRGEPYGKELAMLTFSLVSNPNVTTRGCVPSPYWDGAKGELMWSHCWRYLCLGPEFQKQDYFIDLEWTDHYNVQLVPAGTHRLDWFKPKVVDMFLKFRYADQANPDDYAQFSSRNGQSQYITIPPGGIRQMSVRFKIPYNMIYDTNSGSVNLNTDPRRLLPPPPPPLAITNYSYDVSRNGSLLRSQIYVTDVVNASSGAINTTKMQEFSADIQGSISSYMMTSSVSFPDFALLKSCSPSDVQAVLNTIAAKYGVSVDSLSAGCQYNYKKPTAVSTVGRRRRGRALQDASAPAVCYPRVTMTVSMPLNVEMTGDENAAVAAAKVAADAMYAAVGDEACYVPTGAESQIGTLVTFSTENEKATCDYLLDAFAYSNNITMDRVRTFSCGEQPTEYKAKKVNGGMIAVWVVSGVVGTVLIAVLALLFVAWRHKHAQNLQFVATDGTVSGAQALAPPTPRASTTGNKVVPDLANDQYGYGVHGYTYDPLYAHARSPRRSGMGGVGVAVGEGMDRPSTPTRLAWHDNSGRSTPVRTARFVSAPGTPVSYSYGATAPGSVPASPLRAVQVSPRSPAQYGSPRQGASISGTQVLPIEEIE
ncbi:hypothetical protein HYH03_004922 [Edaphochlamys debaryana]|uniref:Uncharacterized protein n=1 Tax=Edaphochlamys debaryana TaxID=47281 RepID=A0A836C1H5_9CHLO|nr:hypothetical protein HYH03_004922 [Edaphochlamys debaryana]|eukprot:KAG2496916.1 hypothetical protein HYH03_004922 [Edaphochlamys debaryana]